jgi:hypothetical protein
MADFSDCVNFYFSRDEFFDQFCGQRLGHLGYLSIASALAPKEKPVADKKGFVRHDSFALADFSGALAVPVSNPKVFRGAEQGGGGGVAVSHERKLSHFPDIARKIFTFCEKKLSQNCIFFLDRLSEA